MGGTTTLSVGRPRGFTRPGRTAGETPAHIAVEVPAQSIQRIALQGHGDAARHLLGIQHARGDRDLDTHVLADRVQETSPPVHDVQLLVLGRDLIVDVADPQRHAPPVAAQIRDPVGQHRIIANQFLRRTRNATVLRPACPGHLPMPQSTAFDRLIVF